jgi:hypothetical protein
MEIASPPRKLLYQENFSPRKEIIYGICFSSKKTSHPRKLLLREKKSLMELSF